MIWPSHHPLEILVRRFASQGAGPTYFWGSKWLDFLLIGGIFYGQITSTRLTRSSLICWIKYLLKFLLPKV